MLRVSHVGRHTVRPPRVRAPTFPLMPAAYTSALSVQVLDFESFGPLIQRGCLLCGFCSSGQRFVSGFLQIPPRDGHPCLQLTVPPAGPVEDLACSAHAAPPGESPCRAQQRQRGSAKRWSEPLKQTPGQLVTNRGPATHQQEGSLASPIDRGTPTSCFPAAARGSWCSLPLMGIGNVKPRGVSLVTCDPQLITPHGDRKHRRLGLGVAGRHLITPHGDRKPEAKRRAHRCGRCSHYPSWGSETLALLASHRSGAISLPLMGIGNLTRYIRPQLLPTVSLPLMGIGNLTRYIRPPLLPTVSLPLMGIGNRTALRAAQCAQPLLITPHGDRKPVRGAGGGVHRRPADLITPHGDRKLSPMRAAAMICQCSLPLMGIGNPISTGSDGSSVPLRDDHGRPGY